MELSVEKKIDAWLQEPFDPQTRQTVQELINNHSEELEDSFYTDLSFGTGGLRGLMGVGTNRMNIYTVRRATKGLASYLKKTVQTEKTLSVAIGFDNRFRSQEFAQEAALVLSLSGIDVHLCKHLRPTPFVSFLCRYKQANAAIMITASHNPKEYNGYKVYWQDGAQVVPPHDTGIIQEVNAITDFSLPSSGKKGSVLSLGESEDQAYLEAIRLLQCSPAQNKEWGHTLSIVYTSLHGTGITMAPRALEDWGFSSLSFVEQQIIPDGHFPTVKLPNPEDKEALDLGIKKMEATQADILFATDPDADRLGIAVLHKGKSVLINGNQIASICTAYLCQKKPVKHDPAIVTTIVSTNLIEAICLDHNVSCYRTLTGFKYIGELIHLWEENPATHPSFLFGAEESYGFLYGTHSRDKDAIVSCCLLAEIALDCKRKGLTLIDFLYGLYQKYGVFREKTLSINFSTGKEGMEKMQVFMDGLRHTPVQELEGIKIVKQQDYLHGLDNLPPSDVLAFSLENGSKIVVRPSGTEPKVKIYGSVHQMPSMNSLETTITLADRRLENLLTYCKEHL